MDQGVACIKRRGAIKKLHLIGSELPSDVPSRGLVCFYCRQISLYHACRGRGKGRRKAGNKLETNVRQKKAQSLQMQLGKTLCA